MDPSGFTPLPTSSAAAPQALQRPWKGNAMLDTVKVSPDTFSQVMYMSAVPRTEWVRDPVPDADKPQKRTRDGVPQWSVELATVDWRGRTELVNVTVPMHGDPGGKFSAGQPVELAELVFGVTPSRSGNGFTTWWSADAISPVNERTPAGV